MPALAPPPATRPALRDARTVRLSATGRYAAVLAVRGDSVKVQDACGLPTWVRVAGPDATAAVVAYYPPMRRSVVVPGLAESYYPDAPTRFDLAPAGDTR